MAVGLGVAARDMGVGVGVADGVLAGLDVDDKG
jgi:hypothetical protein